MRTAKPLSLAALAAFAVLFAACDSGTTPPEPPVLDGPANRVRTEVLTPQPIQLSLGALPAPDPDAVVVRIPFVENVPDEAVLQVPEGFVVNIYAKNLAGPQWLATTPNGELLVAESRANHIRILHDANGDGVADLNKTFADASNGLDQPFGMVFTEGFFYVANVDSVLRFPFAPLQQRIEGLGEVVTGLGVNSLGHWTRNLVLSPDGQQLYVAVGSESEVREEREPRGTIQVMNLDGSGRSTFAYGLRNPVGMDFHPTTGELYAVVGEREELGDDLVPDFLTRIQSTAFYGWPYAYLSPAHVDPRTLNNRGESKRPDLVAVTQTPDVLFQAHSTPLGLVFYEGTQFPEKYRSGAFVTFYGSRFRSMGTGFKVVFAPFGPDGRPAGYYEDFLTGFLMDPAVPSTWGQPTGLAVLPDGSLVVADEAHDRIYRISYVGTE